MISPPSVHTVNKKPSLIRDLNKSPSDPIPSFAVKLDPEENSKPSYMQHKPLKGVLKSGFQSI
jgi:hypothetical protein